MIIFPWNVKSKFNLCGLDHLLSSERFLASVWCPGKPNFWGSGASPLGPPPGCCPGPYGQYISCLRHDNHSIPHWFYVKRENLQKIYVNRERPHLFLVIRDSDPLYQPLPWTALDSISWTCPLTQFTSWFFEITKYHSNQQESYWRHWQTTNELADILCPSEA